MKVDNIRPKAMLHTQKKKKKNHNIIHEVDKFLSILI